MDFSPSARPLLGRVLIADNDFLIRGVLRSILTKLGQKVEEARDTDEALQKAASAAFDLIILDLDMPGEGGLAGCRRLRQNAATAETPVVILTALSDHAIHTQCLEAGCSLFKNKPFNPALFAQQLQPFLHLGPSGSATLADIVLRDRGVRIEDAALARLHQA